MADASKSRLSLDLEEIERQLRRSAPGTAAPSKSDPLAELARIVGQDDPFRALLAEDRPSRGTAGADTYARREPSFDDPGHAPNATGGYGLRGSLPRHDETGYAQDYRDQPVALTAEEDVILHGHHGHHYAPNGHDPALYYDDEGSDYAEAAYAPVQPRRGRRGLIAAGAVVAAAALAGAGAWTLRSGSPLGPDGEPPVVQADAGPSKIAPQNPGGIDIPNQNKKIYEPVSQDTQTRVVNREEQPVDLRQALRAGGSAPEAVRLSPAVPPQAIPATGAASPLQGSGAIAGALGEPRRVRTVSIRPDGTVVAPDAGGAARPAIPPPPAMMMPDGSRPAAPAVGPQQGAIPQRPRDTAPLPIESRPTPSTSAAAPVGAPLQISPDSARPKGDARLAAAPTATMREPAETSAAPAAASGFAVQLGVRDTDRDARQAFNQFQQRYAGDLSGFSPLIVQAEINGRTAYRVRVGPMSLSDANALCTRLKASGGQCFVANNN